MEMKEFLESIQDNSLPPAHLKLELQALWWLKKGCWDRAHDLVQRISGTGVDWVHAHLHRVEGDLENADYWYHRVGKNVSEDSFHDEWLEITADLLSK